MSNTLSYLFTCTGKINSIKYDLKFGKVLEGEETSQRKGELARLEGILPELLARLTPEEKVEWETKDDKTIDPEEMKRRVRQMDLENVDRDSI